MRLLVLGWLCVGAFGETMETLKGAPGSPRENIINKFMEQVNVSAPGVLREEGSHAPTDEFQHHWIEANGNVSAFGKLRTLKLILRNLPVDGTPLLCGFLDTFKIPSKLEYLEELAREKTVAVAATLSMAAARHYKVTIPNYALFTNYSGVLETAVYPGDLKSSSDLEDWIFKEHKAVLSRARPPPEAEAEAPDSYETCDPSDDSCKTDDARVGEL